MQNLTKGILVALLCVSAQPSGAVSILTNGDFGSGNTGFSASYLYTSSIYDAGTYTVGADPQTHHVGAASYGDHTTGTGLMLIANGSTNPNTTIWEQTVAVDSFSKYEFGAWAASWGRQDWGADPSIDPSPAQLQFFVNGELLGPSFVLPAGDAIWSEFSATWDSATATTAHIRIVDVNLASYGNDFTLDDLTFEKSLPAPVPEPGTMLLLGSGLVGLAGYRRQGGNII